MEKDLVRRSSSTSNFNKKIQFILKLFVLLALVVVYTVALIPQYEDSYNAALVDKVARLKSINEPKIVLIGNSNVAFGYDSKLIEEATGMPVVNMGLHGGLGNKFHDDMMDYNVTPGDIYVISHISYWRVDEIENPLLGWTTFENHKDLWHLVKENDYKNMLHSFTSYVKKLTERYYSYTDDSKGEGAYFRSSFNEYGDIATYREATGRDFRSDIYPPTVDKSEVDALNEWKKYLEDRGATLIIAGFPIITDQWPEYADEKFMDDYQAQLEAEMDCDVISNWKDYCYTSDYFFDTPYHLTTEGARLRSEQFVADLKKWQENR